MSLFPSKDAVLLRIKTYSARHSLLKRPDVVSGSNITRIFFIKPRESNKSTKITKLLNNISWVVLKKFKSFFLNSLTFVPHLSYRFLSAKTHVNDQLIKFLVALRGKRLSLHITVSPSYLKIAFVF